MKLTDLCLVFVMVFICLVLPLELKIKDDREKYYSEKQFNRTMDRIASDAMEDAVISEDGDGKPKIDREKIYARFNKLLSLAFEVEDTSKICDAIISAGFYDNDLRLSYEESENIRKLIRDDINKRISQEKINEYRRDVAFFNVTFPYSSHESWYQNIAGPVFFVTIDPDDGNMPWTGFDRVIFSGSRIEKITP